MKKKNLSKLVLLGLSSAAVLGYQALAFADMDSSDTAESMNSMSMSADEQAFFDKLSDSAKPAFQNMNSAQRAMCMSMASHDCKGQNSCKGQSKCKTDEHACKGQNTCKGKGGCKTSPDEAVKLAGDMAQKRLGLL